jgi:uncharacterized membrane protein YheB (UPF0754 family)
MYEGDWATAGYLELVYLEMEASATKSMSSDDDINTIKKSYNKYNSAGVADIHIYAWKMMYTHRMTLSYMAMWISKGTVTMKMMQMQRKMMRRKRRRKMRMRWRMGMRMRMRIRMMAKNHRWLVRERL